MFFGFKDITAAYGRNVILENVTLDVPRGMITTVIGQNGCGKSSLLKTVSRAVKPMGGYVELDGRPMSEYSFREFARRVAYLPQIRVSPPDIDVRTLVSLGRYPHRKPFCGISSDDRNIIEETLELTGLLPLSGRTLASLSGGERQRAHIAMAVCQRPEVMILDEPSTFLDIGHQLEIMELVKKLCCELSMTVLTVLHDINTAARFSDRIAVLHDKKLIVSGSPSDVLSESLICDVFSVRGRLVHDDLNNCPYFIPDKSL
nr:ABC transporter ATP-binding protein [Clostridia bacterium]